MNNIPIQKDSFQIKMEELINNLSLENESNTPDYILAKFINSVFLAANDLINERERWYGIQKHPGKLSMSLKSFIENFSHNNEVWIENKDNFCMYHKYYPEDDKHDCTVMDWMMQYSDIPDCNVIRISNVIHSNHTNVITIVVNTDKTEFTFLPELVTLDNSPVWFYDKVHQTKTEVHFDA